MTALFTTVLRMSFYGALTAVLAAAVFLLLRRSRCSKTMLLLLWAAAALRLTCPWFPSSPVSVLNLVPASLTQQTAERRMIARGVTLRRCDFRADAVSPEVRDDKDDQPHAERLAQRGEKDGAAKIAQPAGLLRKAQR